MLEPEAEAEPLLEWVSVQAWAPVWAPASSLVAAFELVSPLERESALVQVLESARQASQRATRAH
jgi:hypothetical protein